MFMLFSSVRILYFLLCVSCWFFFFKQKTAYEMRISDWSSDVCSSDLVDGVLREVMAPPRQLAARLVSRIKVMAKLDIAEKRLPQDGRISRAFGDRKSVV